MAMTGHTTFDTSVIPVKCCAHLETTEPGQPTTDFHVYANANTAIQYQNTWYFFAYEPTQPRPKRCCVYYAKQVTIGGTIKYIKDSNRLLFCEDRTPL